MGFKKWALIKMKNILYFTILLFSLNLSAQSYTKKYNDLYNRYDYFNNNGTLIGYKYYDDLYQVWKYKDLSQVPTSSYIKPINTELVGKVLNAKQQKYDANVEKIYNTINEIRNKVYNLNLDPEVIESVWAKFNSQCLDVIDRKKFDYSSSTNTNTVMNFMYESINNIINNTNKKQKPKYIEQTPYKKEFSGYVETVSFAPITKEPNSSSKEIAIVKNGKVEIISKFNDSYYKVKYNNLTGYLLVAWIK